MWKEGKKIRVTPETPHSLVRSSTCVSLLLTIAGPQLTSPPLTFLLLVDRTMLSTSSALAGWGFMILLQSFYTSLSYLRLPGSISTANWTCLASSSVRLLLLRLVSIFWWWLLICRWLTQLISSKMHSSFFQPRFSEKRQKRCGGSAAAQSGQHVQSLQVAVRSSRGFVWVDELSKLWAQAWRRFLSFCRVWVSD